MGLPATLCTVLYNEPATYPASDPSVDPTANTSHYTVPSVANILSLHNRVECEAKISCSQRRYIS